MTYIRIERIEMLIDLTKTIFKCSECGNELEVEDVDEYDDTIFIRPCECCIKEKDE